MYKIFKYSFIVFLTVNMIIYSDKMAVAALSGLNIWLNTIIPSLFPFMVISSWISFEIKNKKSFADKITMKLFGTPSYCIYIFAISFLSGYPVGAKIVSQMYSAKKISSDTAEHLLSFCNNPGIVFIVSALASSMLSDRSSALFFITVCILSSLIGGITYNMFFPSVKILTPISTTPDRISITTALTSAVSSITVIGGCIIFFSVVKESLLNVIPLNSPVLSGILGGYLEFAGGLSYLATLSLPRKLLYPVICSILSFGGLSVLLQTLSIVGKCNIDLKKYIISKIFTSAVSFIIALLLYEIYFTGSLTSLPVYSEISYVPSAFFVSTIVSVFILIANKEKRHL